MNTYSEDDPMEVKMLEEMRLIRCLLERLLNHLSSTHFTDYQLEKFTPKYQYKSE